MSSATVGIPEDRASFDPKSQLLPFSNCTNKAISLTPNQSVQAAAVNPARIYLMIVNLSDAIVYVSLGQDRAVVGQGLPLFGKRSYLEITKEFLFRERVSLISESPAALSFVECTI